MVFGIGVLYEWVQLLVSFMIFRTTSSVRHVGKWVLLLRLLFCVIGTFCFLVGESVSKSHSHTWPVPFPYFPYLAGLIPIPGLSHSHMYLAVS